MSETVFQAGILKGKVAVITGGGSGINLGIAERFVEQGASLAIIGRSQEKLDSAGKNLSARGAKVVGISADVRDYPALDAGMQKVRSDLGPIDILICGAAGNFPARAEAMSANAFKAVIDIDILGTYNTCRAAFAHLRKPGASIINISAGQAFTPQAYQSHVCAAKAGVDMITRTLALEWGPLGVRVNSIVPGPIDDTEGMKRLAPNEEVRNRLTESLPLKRYGTKQDIASLALFLSTDAASYVTGSVMLCDGGLSLVGSGAWSGVLEAALQKS